MAATPAECMKPARASSEPIRIAYLTYYDARDVRAWSGTGLNIAQCLSGAGFQLSYVGPLKKQYHPINGAQLLWNKLALKQNDHPQRDPAFLKHYGDQATELIRKLDADLVFCPGGLPLSYFRRDRPVVLWTDCTFANLLDYYPAFSNLSKRTIRNGHDAERRALHNCDLLLFSSSWAADSAINDYQVDPARVRIVPFGSNMPGLADVKALDDIIADRLARLKTRVSLLASGVNWARKGFDFAVEVTRLLREAGIDAELKIVGCDWPHQPGPSFVQPLGFVSKSETAGMSRLEDLFSQAHWFVFPTQADCTPIVLCESAAYGLPSLARSTGGVGSLVSDEVNGWLMPPDATPQAWAGRIAEVSRDPERYARLCRSTYAEYRQRLNWRVAGEAVRASLEELLAEREAMAAGDR